MLSDSTLKPARAKAHPQTVYIWSKANLKVKQLKRTSQLSGCGTILQAHLLKRPDAVLRLLFLMFLMPWKNTSQRSSAVLDSSSPGWIPRSGVFLAGNIEPGRKWNSLSQCKDSISSKERSGRYVGRPTPGILQTSYSSRLPLWVRGNYAQQLCACRKRWLSNLFVVLAVYFVLPWYDASRLTEHKTSSITT